MRHSDLIEFVKNKELSHAAMNREQFWQGKGRADRDSHSPSGKYLIEIQLQTALQRKLYFGNET